MSSTRKAQAGGELRQEKFSSSKAFNRPLLANLVAKRATKIRSRPARELVYFLMDLSQRDTHARHPTCNHFPAWPWPSSIEAEEWAFARVARELAEFYPESVGVDAVKRLPAILTRVCLDPSAPPETMRDDAAPELFAVVLRYKERFEAASKQRLAMTATAKAIFDVLDYALSQNGLTLALGAHRVGKSFSCQAWAQMNVGKSRYVQLSSARDDRTFFRDIARSLGVTAAQRKTAEIRARIEAVLREQHLLLIIDEADWILPQVRRPREVPARLAWLLTSIVNNGVSVALVGSKNFDRMIKNFEDRCPVYGLEQFHGRVRLRRALPDALATEDLFLIARAVFPESSESTQTLLVAHALKSDVPVGAIESAAARARYFAEREGRPVGFPDIERAMIECGTLPPPGESRAPALQPLDSPRFRPGPAAAPLARRATPAEAAAPKRI